MGATGWKRVKVTVLYASEHQGNARIPLCPIL